MLDVVDRGPNKGYGQSSPQGSDCYTEIFSPWGFFGKEYPPGTSSTFQRFWPQQKHSVVGWN